MGYGFLRDGGMDYVTVNGKNYNERQNRRRIRKNREQSYIEVIPGVPQIEFERICVETAKVFKPIVNVSIDGPSVTCYVRPKILRDWIFHLEFRDHGKSIWNRGSDRSDIAEKYVSLLTSRVERFRNMYTKDWMEATCPNCNGRMIRRTAYDRWYCTSCGCRLSDFTPENDGRMSVWHCSQCGGSLYTRRRFSDKEELYICRNCGSISIVPSSSDIIDKSREEANIVKYCPNCGAYVSSVKGKFCTHCGMKL